MWRDSGIFEKFPDGSILWRACFDGRYEAPHSQPTIAGTYA